MMRIALALFALMAFAAQPLRADDFSDARNVISLQEQALSRDDVAEAYSYASPGIQGQLDPDGFMAMVRTGYAPVYRHTSFEFGKGTLEDGKIKQLVQIVDADGVVWDALYTLERQPDGSLKIAGCTLLKAGQSV